MPISEKNLPWSEDPVQERSLSVRAISLCSFCQNYEISHGKEGVEVGPEQMALMMVQLSEAGCHNINFVTPTHVVPQILEALPHAIERGLRVPLVYNSSGYDSLETLELLDGIFDIYMPDFKFWDNRWAERYCEAPDYREVASAAVREMHRQVGDLAMDERGIAYRGLLVRHLVMPNQVAGTERDHGISGRGSLPKHLCQRDGPVQALRECASG